MGANGAAQGRSVIGSIVALTPGSEWSFGNREQQNRKELRVGETMSVTRGAVELHLVDTAVVQLEAPLILQMISLDRARVLKGRATIDVLKGAEGFTVETPEADVIDLGTTFGVDVQDKGTDVVVYQGQVDLVVSDAEQAKAPAGDETRRLQMGQALHVDQDGTLSRIVTVTRTNFSHTEPRRPLIAAVKDNISRSDAWDFYEIVPGGMGEDQPCFVDRPHQWNGVTGEGMPKYLVGADYVKTFCNDKVTKDLHINLTLSEPATVYVLFDKRATPPDWLTQAFELTGDDIGADETDFDVWKRETVGNNGLKIGPGNSIQHDFSIWRKVVRSAGVVSLGPNGAPTRRSDEPLDLNARMAMYGIVATPLTQTEMKSP